MNSRMTLLRKGIWAFKRFSYPSINIFILSKISYGVSNRRCVGCTPRSLYTPSVYFIAYLLQYVTIGINWRVSERRTYPRVSVSASCNLASRCSGLHCRSSLTVSTSLFSNKPASSVSTPLIRDKIAEVYLLWLSNRSVWHLVSLYNWFYAYFSNQSLFFKPKLNNKVSTGLMRNLRF